MMLDDDDDVRDADDPVSTTYSVHYERLQSEIPVQQGAIAVRCRSTIRTVRAVRMISVKNQKIPVHSKHNFSKNRLVRVQQEHFQPEMPLP